MRQRIVLKMDMSKSEKLMKKAMKIASATSGVRSVSIKGQNDQLLVVGEGIDTAKLTLELTKKVCHTSIISVQAIPPPPPPQPFHNDMLSPERRCMCDIPGSGFCGFCKAITHNTNYQMVAPPYYPPVIYGGYRDDEHGGCILM